MCGRVAQLGECYIRIVEVEGSNPFVSTKMKGTAKAVLQTVDKAPDRKIKIKVKIKIVGQAALLLPTEA